MSTTINIHDLILNGDLEGYEKLIRTQCEAKQKEAMKAKEKEKLQRRQTLQKELDRLNKQMEQLGDAS